ncbi:hypothetical protein HPB48_006821 [Haemaphysalis longicornis]|uniref:Uncharacterized protein n=1 Tax=Haemaphysalis longicornis TaxID=44386 RepID=A0A9J6FEB6_HAELO|nr:hypothetical protein HPB48_006821 [Haemaphysalis longicornis]
MLQAVPRRKEVLWAKVNEKDDGNGADPSSGTPCQSHGPVHGGPLVHIERNRMTSCPRQAAGMRALDWQRRNVQLAHLRAHLASRQGLLEPYRICGSPNARVHTATVWTGANNTRSVTLRPVTK